MQKYTDIILSPLGTPIGGAVITVTNYPSNTPATIYATDGGSAVDSVMSDPTGRFSFYAADGHYNLSISGTGITPQVVNDITLNDPSNDATLAALAASGGSALVGFQQAGAGSVARTAQDRLHDVVSVKDFGAKGDGVTDDTAAIQAALDASVGAATSKTVRFPAGQYIVNGTLTVQSKVSLIGDASGSVRIKQTASNATLLKSYNFDTLTGTSNAGGVRRVHLRDITFEATMSAGVPAGTNAQHGIQIYGYGCTFENVHVRYFGGIGISMEWANPGTSPDSGYDDGFTENRLIAVKCYENGLSGIKCAGANDGQWFGVVSYSNNMNDASTDKPNVWITSKGNPQYIDQLHAWGNTSATALLLEGSATCSNCALEGATGAQLKIKTGEVVFHGGLIFAAGATSSKGIQFVGGTGVCIGYDINTSIENCNGGSIDFGTGIDAAKITVRAYQTSGVVFAGTIPSAGIGNSLNFTVAGGADNRQTKQKHYHITATNLSLVDSTSEGVEYATHGGEGVIALPQRKTEPAGNYYPASGVLGYGRANALRFHQSSSNTIGALMGEPSAAVTPADNLDLSYYQLNTLAAAGAPITINNFVGGLNGAPVFVLLPSSGSTVTIGTAGNIKTKSGSSIASTTSKQLLCFVKARDGNYYQV